MTWHKRPPNSLNWQDIGQRSSSFHFAGNRNAAHPVNAILNYAYATLESGIRIKAVCGGYDPTIGIMREGSQGSSKVVCRSDVDPSDRKLDREVVDLVKAMFPIRPTFFIRTDGVCRLNPENGR